MFLSIILLFVCAYSQTYDPSLYSLGSNLIFNPTFSDPALSPGSMVSFYPGSITGWSCDSSCQVTSIIEICSSFSLACSNNFTQSLDLDGSS